MGYTHHHTHPGNYCEILIRDCLRKFLPAGLSADKGFFYGRGNLFGKNEHSPEIDILIHNTAKFRPLMQVDDFVIVPPESVVGIIQIKKTFTKAEIKSGIVNVVKARMLLQILYNQIDPMRKPSHPFNPFLAVIGIADDVGLDTNFYSELLQDWWEGELDSPHPGRHYYLPHIIGSLRRCILYKSTDRHMVIYDNYHDGKNLFIQFFLHYFYEGYYKRAYNDYTIPVHLPDVEPIHEITVPLFQLAWCEAARTLTVTRTDQITFIYKNMGAVNPYHRDTVHIIISNGIASDQLAFRRDPTSVLINVKIDGGDVETLTATLPPPPLEKLKNGGE